VVVSSSTANTKLYWTFGFHIMLGSSCIAPQLAAPQEGLSSMKLLLLLLLLFCRRCSPWWTLASLTIALHWSRSWDFRLQFLRPTVFKSSSAESSHLTEHLVTRRVTSGEVTHIYSYIGTAHSRFTRVKSLILLGRFRCFRPAAIVESFSTIKAFYGVGLSNPHPTPWPGGPE
jgi:hypothetical protein